jgi:hypothetical protein
MNVLAFPMPALRRPRYLTIKITFDFLQAVIIRFASEIVFAMGFSTKKCLP